jgi:hypothetical protein
MAVSNLTYVTIHDGTAGSPEYGNAVIAFSNYNEAMSFAKWASYNFITPSQNYIMVWNYYGGSGWWRNSTWTETANSNWP